MLEKLADISVLETALIKVIQHGNRDEPMV